MEDLVEPEGGRQRIRPRSRVRERPEAVEGSADEHQHRSGDAERREELRYDDDADPADGEVRQQFSLAFRARLIGGEPRTSSESDRVEWVDPTTLDELSLHPSMRLRIAHALVRDERPVIG